MATKIYGMAYENPWPNGVDMHMLSRVYKITWPNKPMPDYIDCELYSIYSHPYSMTARQDNRRWHMEFSPRKALIGELVLDLKDYKGWSGLCVIADPLNRSVIAKQEFNYDEPRQINFNSYIM